jgi:hypothetical protein
VPSAVERQARRHSAMLRIRIDPTTAPRLHEGARDYRRLGDCMKRREALGQHRELFWHLLIKVRSPGLNDGNSV